MATVRVRLFARQRQIAGSREVNVELADGATVADAWAAVVALFPALGTDTPYVRYGRNGTYAAADEARNRQHSAMSVDEAMRPAGMVRSIRSIDASSP